MKRKDRVDNLERVTISERISRLELDVELLKEDNKDLRREDKESKDYIIYITRWSQTVNFLHAQHNWEPDLPPLMSFDEWKIWMQN